MDVEVEGGDDLSLWQRIRVRLMYRFYYSLLQNLINNGGTGAGGPWDKGVNTVHDMIKEMKVDFAPLTAIAPTPRNELAYNLSEVPKHKVSTWGITLR